MGPRILVVDDDEDVRDCIGRILRVRGYLVRGAGDGAAALQLMLLEVPDVVVLDLCMPVRDGWWVRRQMLAAPELRRVPVVLATGVDVPAAGLAALHCVATLKKPFRPQHLLEALSGAVREAA